MDTVENGDLNITHGVPLVSAPRYFVSRTNGRSTLTFSTMPLLLAWLQLTVDAAFSKDRLYTVLSGTARRQTRRLLDDHGLHIDKFKAGYIKIDLLSTLKK